MSLAMMRLLVLLLSALLGCPVQAKNCCHQCHQATGSHWTAEARALLRTIKSLEFGYERSTRPTFLKGHTSVYIILVITKITVKNGLFVVELTVHQRWRDPRLVFSSYGNSCNPTGDNVNLQEDDMASIWTPDTFFEKEAFSSRRKGVQPSQSVTIFCDGTVSSRIRLSTTVYCSMIFTAFPHDKHTCTFMISSWAYKTDALIFHWDRNSTRELSGMDSYDLEQFIITNISYFKTQSDIPHSGKYSRIIVQFGFKRKPHYFILNFYFPAILVVSASWTSFWIEARSTTARVQLGITTVLATLTLMIQTLDSAEIPNVSALKAIDVYMMVCFTYAFMAFLVYPFVHSLLDEQDGDENETCEPKPEVPVSPWDAIFEHFEFSTIKRRSHEDEEEEERERGVKKSTRKVLQALDRHSRWLFPLSFVIFNILYFAIVLNLL